MACQLESLLQVQLAGLNASFVDYFVNDMFAIGHGTTEESQNYASLGGVATVDGTADTASSGEKHFLRKKYTVFFQLL